MAHNKIILASASRARKDMLINAGLKFQSIPADIDETKIIESLRGQKAKPEVMAVELAQQKAKEISAKHPDAIIIGSDQILECEGQIFEKAKDEAAAKQKLKTLRGKTHRLISAVCIAHENKILWQTHDEAKLTMHDFDDAFLEEYAGAAKDDITRCVGGYAIEKSGAWLFSAIKGDYFTILGMPLLPLLDVLKDEHGCKP